MRNALFLLVFLASCASAQQAMHQPKVHADAFVHSSDECGASRYAHLVGEQYAKVEQASLPSTAVVQHQLRKTLEYRPGQLNVVVGSDGRILAVACY